MPLQSACTDRFCLPRVCPPVTCLIGWVNEERGMVPPLQKKMPPCPDVFPARLCILQYECVSSMKPGKSRGLSTSDLENSFNFLSIPRDIIFSGARPINFQAFCLKYSLTMAPCKNMRKNAWVLPALIRIQSRSPFARTTELLHDMVGRQAR